MATTWPVAIVYIYINTFTNFYGVFSSQLGTLADVSMISPHPPTHPLFVLGPTEIVGVFM
jgi:hypothetical protein